MIAPSVGGSNSSSSSACNGLIAFACSAELARATAPAAPAARATVVATAACFSGGSGRGT
eukprot:10449869-Alexandrium_andersonii.AAC.1